MYRRYKVIKENIMPINTCEKLAPIADMDINKIGRLQYEWVERMGWHNKSVLESLALIASEIGEAADECFGPTPAFGEELADIVLRTADLAQCQMVDLGAVISGATVTWRTHESLVGAFSEVMVDMAKWINTARSATLGDDFGQAMGRVIKRVFEMAVWAGVDIHAEVVRKMEINEQRGTRGRRI
jgi:NTP pyrophosphatase (non-canonical NTP hydrolase)